MPHFKLWHFAPELSADQREHLAAALEEVAVEILGSSRSAVSVDEIAVDEKNWKAEVFDVEITPRLASLIHEPGYTM